MAIMDSALAAPPVLQQGISMPDAGALQGSHPNYPIQSVANALRLLSAFQERSAVGVAEASRELGVARSTAHRLLAMLQEFGFVSRDANTRKYYPGPSLVGIAAAVGAEHDLKYVARPYLESLATAFGETAHLCVLQGSNVVFVDGVESTKISHAGLRTGVTLPAYATSVGKALLAALPQATLFDVLPREKLTALTPRTINSRTALLKELRKVRLAGYAINSSESENELMAFGAVAVGRSGATRIAFSISGPERRMSELDRDRVVTALRNACAAAGRHLR